MNNHERAARLMIEAEKLGCDTPSESMIADAINDAEVDAYQEIEVTLEQSGFFEAAKAVDRWRSRKWDGDSQPEPKSISL